MSPPRRRSARLAGTALKKKALPSLPAVVERAESPEPRPQITKDVASPSPARQPATPATAKVKPPHEEMHPSKAHPRTAEPSSALRLGFADIKSSDKSGRHGSANQQATPSKVNPIASPVAFKFKREPTPETELSEDAKRMMAELREQAAKIKADLVADREAGGVDANGRKIAMPKGKSGRFSSAHMAEFKKMDSIKGHASAWRAQPGRTTPVASGTKRTSSKANLETTPVSQIKPCLTRSGSKTNIDHPPTTPRAKANLKRSSTRANLDEYQESPSPKKAVAVPMPPMSAGKQRLFAPSQPALTAKRLKKNLEDDASTTRPISQETAPAAKPTPRARGLSKLPQSQSSLARLMSPTKASTNHVATSGKPSEGLLNSPSKPSLIGGLSKSATFQNLSSIAKPTTPRAPIASPSRFQKVKSILRGHGNAFGSAQTSIPQPTVSQTPAPPKIEKTLPPVPLTTPRRKLTKRVAFTPEVTRVTQAQDSPSPKKASILKKVLPQETGEVYYPSLDALLAETQAAAAAYPDLSVDRPLPEPPVQEKEDRAQQPTTPGKFTFRSDHTIEFGPMPNKGFGASPGQSSIRHVRPSLLPVEKMPGSFPAPPSPCTSSNKENKAPTPAPKVLIGAPHGMSNKKRHRAASDEEEADKEAAQRAAKKRKNQSVPEGEALLAPRLLSKTSMSARKPQTPRSVSRTMPASASPTKKRAMISMSRLNLLSQPKNRN